MSSRGFAKKSSSSDKMRARLNAISKGHEDVDIQKRQLEDESRRQRLAKSGGSSSDMNNSDRPSSLSQKVADDASVGTTSSAGKGMVSIIADSPQLSVGSGYGRKISRTNSNSHNESSSRIGMTMNTSDSTASFSAGNVLTGASAKSTSELAVASNIRVSNWVHGDDLESSPPVVKSTEVYETVRLLGRGSFGDVNLVKSVEEGRMYADKTIYQ